MKPLMYAAIGFSVAVFIYLAVFGQRTYHNIQRKRGTVNTYAIVNVKTGTAIRVQHASIQDEADIVLHKHACWECMTWQVIELADGFSLLKNPYTHKTSQPTTSPAPGVELWQQPIEANPHQYWELYCRAFAFVKTME